MTKNSKLEKLTIHLLTPREAAAVVGGAAYCQHKQTGDPYSQQNGYVKVPQYDQSCPGPRTELAYTFDFTY